MRIKSFLVLMFVAGAFSAKAQRAPGSDTVLKGSTIEVIQAYKPQIKSAPKPEWVPQVPPADTTHPSFTYDVPQQTLYYTYSSMPLRPLALGKEAAKLPYPNYVKLGGGNFSTVFLDAGIAQFYGQGYETNIHLHHISQSGTLTDQRTALSGIEAEGMLHTAKADWHATVSGERNQYSFYGGDRTVLLTADSMKQVYTAIRAAIDVKNREDSSTLLTYHPAINASFYNARFDANEINLGFNAPVVYKFSKAIDGQAAILGSLVNYTAGTVTQNNNFLEVLPGIRFHEDHVSGHALFGFALGKDSKTYFLPDVEGAYAIPNTKFTVSAGWKASLRQNTYEQLTTENPYLYSFDSIRQTRSDEVFLNLLGSYGDHLSFSGRISYWDNKELPTFLNDLGDMKHFYVRYQDAKAISFKLGARYQVANIWSVGATADFYGFYGQSDPHVWGQPNLKIKGDFMVVPIRKLTVTAYLALLNGIYARDASHNPVKLNMIADLGANAEYQLISRLSAFVQVSNLFSDKYQRWNGYPVYGLNIYGGLRLKF